MALRCNGDMTIPNDRENADTAQVDIRSLARLYAVQALYQIEFADKSAGEVIGEFKDRGFVSENVGVSGEPDIALFEALVRSATAEKKALNDLIAAARGAGPRTDNLERLLLAILRCGASELMASPDLPVSVIVNEYVDIAHAFYGGNEPGLINGVLDKIAQLTRGSSATGAG